MNFYQIKLTEKRNEALKAVLPIIGIVLLLSFTIAPVPPGILLLFLFAALMLIIGMMFFTLGAELSMVPMGERAGTKMAKSMRLEIVLFRCFRRWLLPDYGNAPHAVVCSTFDSSDFILWSCIYTDTFRSKGFSGGSFRFRRCNHRTNDSSLYYVPWRRFCRCSKR